MCAPPGESARGACQPRRVPLGWRQRDVGGSLSRTDDQAPGGDEVIKLRMVLLAMLVAGLALSLTAAPQADEPERNIPLLDAPNGQPVGWVRDSAQLEVVERRAGWKRVRFEGWISESPLSAVRGQAKGPQGSEVLLLSSSPRSRELFQQAQEKAIQEQAPKLAEVDELRRERNRALRISNFQEATMRYDELDAQYDARVEELLDLRKRLLAEMVQALSAETVMATYLRGDGTFEVNPPGPGSYSLFVMLAEEKDFPCCLVDVETQGEDVWVELKKKKSKRRSRSD